MAKSMMKFHKTHLHAEGFMDKQKIGIIIQWIFDILFIIAGIGNFSNSIPYAIANLLFGVSLLSILWNPLRKNIYS